MAGSKNDTQYSRGYNIYPTTSAETTVLQLETDATQLLNVSGDPNGVVPANVGSLAQDRTNGDVYLKVSGTGTTVWNKISTGGSVSTTFTGDTGTATPSSNNINLKGQQAGTIPVMDTIASGSTVQFENRTWQTQLVVDPSATVGLRGTFTTIASAIAAATSGQTIYIRPGTYTENLTLKAGVNLTSESSGGFHGSAQGITRIIGTISQSSGNCSISNIYFNVDGANLFELTGTGILNLNFCYLNPKNGKAFNSSTSGAIFLNYCEGNIATGGSLMDLSVGSTIINCCNIRNTGNSTVTSNISTTFTSYGSYFETNFTITAAVTTFRQSTLNCSNINTTCITTSTAGSTTLNQCILDSGTATAAIVSSGTLTLSECTVKTSNTNAFSGAGTLINGGIIFGGTSSLNAVTTQTPQVHSNDAVKITTPAAYPYTTVPQDAVILVDSSSARSIVPLASPTTGQMHRIKDNSGLAGTNNITITPSGKNIDGASSTVINVNFGSVDIVYNGTQWNIL